MKNRGLSLNALLAASVMALSASGVWADTLAASPAACTSLAGVGIAWSTPGNARVSDNVYATVPLDDNQTSNYLQCLNYGFAAIPAWAVINDISVNVERKSSSAAATVPTDADVFLVKGGVIGTTDRATSTLYTTADVTEAHGVPPDLWGTSWTAADLKAGNFGVAFAARKPGSVGGSRTVSVDFIQVVVDYSIPARTCTSVVTGNWSNANTWNCGSGPGDGPPVATDSVVINNQIVSLDTNASVTSLTINSGTLQQSGAVARSLTVSGSLSNSGTIVDNGASGSFSLSVGGGLTGNGNSITVDSLAVGGNTVISSPLTVTGSFNVGGDLTNNSAALTVNNLIFQKAGTQAATFYGTASAITNFTVNSGTTVASANYSTVNLKGTLSNNGSISLPNTSWLINGTSGQSIAGSADSTLGNLTMSNASGLSLSRNVVVPGTLTLNNGVINTGAFALSATANCPGSVSGGSAASYVNGSLRLTFPAFSVTCVYPIGSATAYAPAALTIPWFAGISGGTLTASTTNGEHPQVATSLINPAQDVNRYWTLGTPGDTMATLPSGGSYSLALNFVAGDVDAGATVANFKVGRYASGWSALAGSASGTTASYPGGSSFGSFAVGTPVPAVVVLGKTVSTPSDTVGSYVTFTLSASNPHAQDLSNVVLTDLIPTDLTYSISAATAGSVGVSDQTLVWTIPALVSGASEQLSLVVRLAKKGTYTNTVTSPGATSASASILVVSNAFVHYRMDETAGSWTGTGKDGEVIDSGVNALSGRRLPSTATGINAYTPSPVTETIAGQYSSVIGDFCNAGSFDGSGVVQSATSSYFQFTNQLSASAWIYPTAYPSELASILSNDTNYEFHLNPSGKLYWWWQAATLTSNATIPLNKWTHIAITLDSTANRRQRIYINGVQDSATNNWMGTLAGNACPFYIGGDVATGTCDLIAARNFRGKIDEVKIYDYELSAAEVQTDMNLGRLCGASAFDHIRIEHDANASICTPETVRVKACLNSSCTSLYPGQVTMTLSPAGWVGGNSITFSGGVTTATLSNASITPPSLTLGGTVTGVARPANTTTRCFSGSTETCTLTVSSPSCAFDAAEVGANPQTRIFTKLAGTAFDLDVLALSGSTTINPAYTGTVTVDLVDSSSTTCPTVAGLSTAQNVDFVSTGRKTVTFSYPDAARNVRVRAKAGSAPAACSSDNFAIRPAQFTMSSSMNNNALTGTPEATAGSAFKLTAGAGVTKGFNGTPALDVGKVSDHNGVAIASGTLSGSFDPGTGTSASGSAFKYLDVGNIQLAEDAVVDSGFTLVDQTKDCVSGSTSTTLTTPAPGKYGCNIGSVASAKFGRWYPSHYSFAGTLTPGCAAGSFTYMGQDALGVDLTVRAHASTGLPAAVTDPVVSRYNYAATGGYPSLAGVTFAGDNGGSTVAASRLTSPAFPSMPITNLWSAGQLRVNDTYVFSKLTTPDGPYDVYKMLASVADPDNASPTLVGAGTNETGIRFGRLRLISGQGSDVAPFIMKTEAQYWDGAYWRTNILDSCTSYVKENVVCTGPVSTSVSSTMGINKGYGSITLAKPDPAGAGIERICLDMASTANGCSGATSAASLDYLLGNWGAPTYDRDPFGNIEFGRANSNTRGNWGFIYRRENF